MRTNDALTFHMLDENDNEIECEVLFTFTHNETGKNYMIYTDNAIDEDGNTKVYASSYDPDDPEPRLEPIQSDAEWNAIEDLLDMLQTEALLTQGDF